MIINIASYRTSVNYKRPSLSWAKVWKESKRDYFPKRNFQRGQKISKLLQESKKAIMSSKKEKPLLPSQTRLRNSPILIPYQHVGESYIEKQNI